MTPPPSANPSDAPPPAPKPLGRRTAHGLAWYGVSLVATKSASVLSQLVLGWLLSKGDFGLYALAISASTLVVVLRDGGARKVLIHEGERYAELARPVFWIAFLCNLLAGVILVLAAPLLARGFDAPALPPLLWVLAAALPLSTFGTIQRTKLAIDLRFKESSWLTTSSAVLRQASAVVFALCGLGAMSFVLPMIVIALFEAVASRYLVGPLPVSGRLTWGLTKELFGKSKWLMLSTLALALVLQGDYLAVGMIQPAEVLGEYFFAFQLTVAVSSPFTGALASVLTPSLTRLKDDPQRQGRAFLRAVEVLSLASAPICVVGALMAGPMIHTLWQGKWDGAIPAVQLLTISLPLRLLLPLSMSLIESRGLWRWSAAALGVDAVGTMLSAAIGALLGGATSVAAWVSGERGVLSLAQCLIVRSMVAVRCAEILSATLVPLVVMGGCGLVGLTVAWMLTPDAAQWSWVRTAIAVPSCLLLATVAALTVVRERSLATVKYVRGLRKPARSGTEAPASPASANSDQS